MSVRSLKLSVCTIPEAAKLFGMPASTMRKWINTLLPEHPELRTMASVGKSGRVDGKIDLGVLEGIMAKRTLALRLQRIEEVQEEHSAGLAQHAAKLREHDAKLARLEATRVVVR
jgi:transposase